MCVRVSFLYIFISQSKYKYMNNYFIAMNTISQCARYKTINLTRKYYLYVRLKKSNIVIIIHGIIFLFFLAALCAIIFVYKLYTNMICNPDVLLYL